MDLRDILIDSSLNNLEWLGKPETFDPETGMTQDLDIKDELEVEWGTTGDIGAPEKAPVCVKKSCAFNMEDVVLATRVLLMSGRMGRSLVAALRKKFGDDRLRKAVRVVRAALANEGITGCIAVDPKGFSDCGDALKVAQDSPYSRMLKFVLMKERCAGCVFLGKIQKKELEASSPNDVAIDDFFAQTEGDIESRPFCMRLNRPILSGQQDFDESEMDDTLIDLMTLGELTEDEVDSVKALKKSAYQKVRAAFLHVHNKHRQAEREKYADKVDASKFIVKQDMVVEVDAALEKPRDVRVSVVAPVPTSVVQHPAAAPDIDIDLDTDECPTGIEVIAEQKDIEVDASTFVEQEFEGTDVVALDEKKLSKKLLKVDHRSDLTI